MKKKIIIGCLILLVVAAAAAGNILKAKNKSEPVFGGGKAIIIQTAKAVKGDLSSYISADGYVRETEKAEIFFESPLKVTKILAEKNQQVKKGDKLLEVDMDYLYSELEKLKLKRTSEEIALEGAGSSANVSKAKNAVNTAERAYNLSKNSYDKDKQLLETGALSKNDFDRTEAQYKDALDSLNNAKLAYNDAVSGTSVDYRLKEASLRSTFLEISDLEKKIQKTLDSLYSPISGVISEQNVEAGSYTDNIKASFVVINTGKLEVRANVREYDIRNIAAGQEVKITGDALGKDESVSGSVKSISPVAITNRTNSGEETVVEVIADVQDKDSRLKPGLSVTCDISTSSRKNTLIVPMEVIDEDKDGNKYIYTVNSERNTMSRKPVKLGITSEMSVEVLEGINDGDTVIINPQPTFMEGAKVRVMDQGKNGKK